MGAGEPAGQYVPLTHMPPLFSQSTVEEAFGLLVALPKSQ
jgi:hypothetical protein